MTIGSWVLFGFVFISAIFVGMLIWLSMDNSAGAAIGVVVAIALIAGSFFGLRWYHTNTASGQRALVDQNSNFGNGLERTVTIYTANGDVIAQYTGKIDIEGNDGGYVLFDFEGKRYTYYNCFVESIADIG